MKKYRVQIDQYVTNCQITSKCNYIKFTNVSTGAVSFKINNATLTQGQSIEIFGNENEIDITVYDLQVGTTIAAVCQVIRKYYL